MSESADQNPSATPVAVIFDFDGTLANSREAAWSAFQRVDQEFGLGIESAEAFYALFADSFHAALARRCGDALAARAWERYSAILEAEYFPQLVPGMAAVIRDLARESPLAVMSANTITVVRRALEQAGVATCFGQAFCGDKLNKRDALSRFLADPGSVCKRDCGDAYEEVCAAAGPKVHRTVLVTDTTGDIREARSVGVQAIGVAWGMHGTEALLTAGAAAVVIWPQEIPAAVRSFPAIHHGALQVAREAASRRRTRARRRQLEDFVVRSAGSPRGAASPRVMHTTSRGFATSVAPLLWSHSRGMQDNPNGREARRWNQQCEGWVMAVEAEG